MEAEHELTRLRLAWREACLAVAPAAAEQLMAALSASLDRAAERGTTDDEGLTSEIDAACAGARLDEAGAAALRRRLRKCLYDYVSAVDAPAATAAAAGSAFESDDTLLAALSSIGDGAPPGAELAPPPAGPAPPAAATWPPSPESDPQAAPGWAAASARPAAPQVGEAWPPPPPVVPEAWPPAQDDRLGGGTEPPAGLAPEGWMTAAPAAAAPAAAAAVPALEGSEPPRAADPWSVRQNVRMLREAQRTAHRLRLTATLVTWSLVDEALRPPRSRRRPPR